MPWKHKPIPADIGDFVYIDKAIPHGLRWKHPRSRSLKVGDPAGSLSKEGVYKMRFYCKFYLNHRVIYFLETGTDPGQLQIDHVQHNCNAGPLRIATHQQNQFNRRKRRGACSRYKGVVATKGKWSAGITVDGNRHYLGLFNTEIEAALAYNQAAVSMFGEYAFLNTFDD